MRVHINGVGFNDSYTYTIKAPKCRVIFSKFKCIDETNPELKLSNQMMMSLGQIVPALTTSTEQPKFHR